MLGRPHHVGPLLASLTETAPQARVVFAVTPTDTAVQSAIWAAGYGGDMVKVEWKPRGDYARKINTVYRETTEPYIFCGASDLRFHPGWWQAAVACLADGIGVVGTNDLGSPRVMRGQHSTHSLVTRDYADRFGLIDQPGTVLCEAYVHEFVDDELVETAKRRGAWAFAADSLVEHLHPDWNKQIPGGPRIDRTYAAQRARMRAGRPIYAIRSRLWAT
jgi:hypothetical protein